MTTPHDLNLRHLRAIALIAASGSISATAALAGLSQPALTQGLAKLETQFATALFERRPEGMNATEAGRLVAERVGSAFAHLAAAARKGPRGFARPEQLMTAAQVRAFLALADTGSFVGAAQATGLSQPAIHRAVRDLEAVIGAALVERRGRGVVLNGGGRRLARGMRLAWGEIAAAIAETGATPGDAGTLAIGAMPLSRAALLPRAIARLAAEHPNLGFSIVEGGWRDLVEPLRDGTLDLMIGALRPAVADLDQQPLLEDRLVVVASASHPLVRATRVDVDDLSRFPWIVGQPGSPLRLHWEALFAGRAQPQHPIACGSVMTIRGLLADGDFLTLLSPAQIALEVSAGVLAHVGHPLTESARTIGIVTRHGWRPTTPQRRFLALSSEIAQELQEIE